MADTQRERLTSAQSLSQRPRLEQGLEVEGLVQAMGTKL